MATRIADRPRERCDVVGRACEHLVQVFDISFGPRSPEGSDSIFPTGKPILNGFDPRSREGSDKASGAIPLDASVSIRAPAKGATCRSPVRTAWGRRFDPHPREGSDVGTSDEAATNFEFRSALPRRERLSAATWRSPTASFDPRSREGSDWQHKRPALIRFVFRSALPRRERQRRPQHTFNLRLFRSALPRRERHTFGRAFMTPKMFRSALPRRERPQRS